MKGLIIAVILILALAIPISAIKFEQLRVVSFDEGIWVRTSVSSDDHVDDVKVTAYLLDSPAKTSDGRFDLGNNRNSNLWFGEVVPGYYTIRISVSTDGERRTKYRFIEIE